MKNYGYAKIASVSPQVQVADTDFNAKQIITLCAKLARQKVCAAVMPELSLTGYTCGDLFLQPLLLKNALKALSLILKKTKNYQMLITLGLPLELNPYILNCAVVCAKGKILAVIPKTYLPNNREFYEKRWFTSAEEIKQKEIEILGQKVPLATRAVFKTGEAYIAVEICEDLWSPLPPSNFAALNGADIIFNLSASNELAGKNKRLRRLISAQSARCLCAYAYASSGTGESSTDAVFSGNALIYENGRLLAAAPRFVAQDKIAITEIDVNLIRNLRLKNSSFKDCAVKFKTEDFLFIDAQINPKNFTSFERPLNALPFVPQGKHTDKAFEEILSIQTCALMQRIKAAAAKSAVLGISGGLDSALALLVCARAFDALKMPRKNILAVTMPCFGTTSRTYKNAVNLIKSARAKLEEIKISKAVLQHFKDIKHNAKARDCVYENAQARERTQILMSLANKHGGLVIGTGDLSELALGWATYNGDHMSMYGVNAGIAKTLTRALLNYQAQTAKDKNLAKTLKDILNTPVSPELLPPSKKVSSATEDILGPYELHDFFLYNFLYNGFTPKKIYALARIAFQGTYDKEQIKKCLFTFFKRFFAQQFKRSCLPDGPKVTEVSLSPRADLKMPSDAQSSLWLKEIEEIK